MNNFNKHFEIKTDLTQQDIESVYKLRKLAYIDESHSMMKPPVDKMKTDTYDKYSIILLVQDKQNKIPIATFRMVIMNKDLKQLPLNEYSDDTGFEYDDTILPVNKSAEISRLCVSKQMISTLSKNIIKYTSYVVEAMFDKVAELCIKNNIDILCCIMEDKLADKLSKCGYHFIKCGNAKFFLETNRYPYIMYCPHVKLYLNTVYNSKFKSIISKL